MKMKPEIIKNKEQKYIGLTAKFEMPRLPEIAPELIGHLFAYIEQRKIKTTGPLFFRYRKFNEQNGNVTLDICMPVAKKIEAQAPFLYDTLPAGKYLKATHIGPYEQLYTATLDVMEWAGKNEIEFASKNNRYGHEWESRIERYTISHAQEPNPKKWQTEIEMLVK